MTIFGSHKNKTEFLLPELSVQKAKHISQLNRKKFRDKLGCFLCEGEKLVKEAIASEFIVNYVVGTSGDLLGQFAEQQCYLTDAGSMKDLSNLSSAPGLMAVVEKPEPPGHITDGDDQFILALDRISDPGNLGTIIRQADWFGLRHIVVSTESVDAYNPKVVQAAMGSLFRVKCVVTHLARAIKWANEQGITSIGAAADGEPVYGYQWPKPAMLVMGSETHGLSYEAAEALAKTVAIPRRGGAESLNLAAATAILLNERFRAG